ncbi:hypothetical protein GB880_001735 [Paracoccus sp. SMMA_5_TC]|nr:MULTISPECIES: hypothetical protein [unclassified Paracoccus (in: a-proteobacteria)]UXU75252.1 hypothetical protein GB879_001740 [Paracoccus sp. SMMA_5]UXU81153.1 hypothetical protein GB880_001735 [Paracoccus sp. SMMA_5_TC]
MKPFCQDRDIRPALVAINVDLAHVLAIHVPPQDEDVIRPRLYPPNYTQVHAGAVDGVEGMRSHVGGPGHTSVAKVLDAASRRSVPLRSQRAEQVAAFAPERLINVSNQAVGLIGCFAGLGAFGGYQQRHGTSQHQTRQNAQASQHSETLTNRSLRKVRRNRSGTLPVLRMNIESIITHLDDPIAAGDCLLRLADMDGAAERLRA